MDFIGYKDFLEQKVEEENFKISKKEAGASDVLSAKIRIFVFKYIFGDIRLDKTFYSIIDGLTTEEQLLYFKKINTIIDNVESAGRNLNENKISLWCLCKKTIMACHSCEGRNL